MELYATTYAGTRSYQVSERELRARDNFLERRVQWIDQKLNLSRQPGRVLDIGCSLGSLLKAFQKRGWDAYGIEPTPHYAEIARKRCGDNIFTCFLEDADLPRSYFDIITLTQTLEHLPNPVQIMAIIRNLLKDDGILYIDVPNVLKPHNFQMFVAPHLYSYSPNTLSLLFRKAGFQPVNIESSWHIKAIAKKCDIASNINYSVEGDNWQKVSGNLKWGYVRLMPRLIILKLITLITGTIRYILGESRGSNIIEAIRGFLHLG